MTSTLRHYETNNIIIIFTIITSIILLLLAVVVLKFLLLFTFSVDPDVNIRGRYICCCFSYLYYSVLMYAQYRVYLGIYSTVHIFFICKCVGQSGITV